MPTFARINRDGIPVHRHDPYDYWQYPWEVHTRRAPDGYTSLHNYHDAAHPIRWYNTAGTRLIRPTDAMIELYNRAMLGDIRTTTQRYGQREEAVAPISRNSMEFMAAVASLTPDSRRFGIEIECIDNKATFIRSVREKGVSIQDEGYNHVTRNYWKVVTDSSVHYHGRREGFYPMEVVSPPLRGENGLWQLKQVCDSLRETNALVNATCGLHVHHDAADLTVPIVKTLVKNWYNAQPAIDSIVSPSRRTTALFEQHRFCTPITTNDLSALERYSDTSSLSEIAFAMGTRYKTLNIESYSVHRTIEVRQHQGTVEYDKIAAWVELGKRMIDASVKGILLPRTSQLDTIMSHIEMPTPFQTYYINRARELTSAR